MKELVGSLFAALLIGGYVFGATALGIYIGQHTGYPYAFAAVFGYAIAAIAFPAALIAQASE